MLRCKAKISGLHIYHFHHLSVCVSTSRTRRIFWHWQRFTVVADWNQTWWDLTGRKKIGQKKISSFHNVRCVWLWRVRQLVPWLCGEWVVAKQTGFCVPSQSVVQWVTVNKSRSGGVSIEFFIINCSVNIYKWFLFEDDFFHVLYSIN